MDKTKIIVLDRGDYTTCTVNPQGATVTSWRINNQEQLFVSRQSQSHEFSHIMGGIQLIFPHFGVCSLRSKLGFARTLGWVLEEGPKVLETGDVFAVFSMADDFYTRALWGYKFRLLYMITLCKHKLVFRICVENLCESSLLHFHIMQNAAFRVPDVSKCEVVGLKSCRYRDDTDGKVNIEEEEAVSLSGLSNRTYTHVPNEVALHNMIGGRTLRIQQKMTNDINLWNPKVKRAVSIIDLGDEEYRHCVALKIGLLTEQFHLEPLSSWMACHTFEIVELRMDKKLLHDFYDFLSEIC